jgi:hypothetical protein
MEITVGAEVKLKEAGNETDYVDYACFMWPSTAACVEGADPRKRERVVSQINGRSDTRFRRNFSPTTLVLLYAYGQRDNEESGVLNYATTRLEDQIWNSDQETGIFPVFHDSLVTDTEIPVKRFMSHCSQSFSRRCA